jgi:hypothetical protein
MRLLFSTVAALLVSVVSLRAAVVFTNFQSGGAAGCAARTILVPFACAAAFTPSANYIMTDAQVKVQAPAANFGNFELDLYSNNAGLPSSSLGRIGTATAPTSFGIVTVNSPALSLVSGTEYWLVMGPRDPLTTVFWADGGSPVPPTALSSNWTGQSNSSQFQIDGSSVGVTPEPTTLGLAAVGMLCFVALRWRFSNGSK